MTRVELAVLLYALLLWQAWGAEFSITSLSIGGVNQTVAASSMQSFVDIHTMTRASSEFYLAVMQLQNSGPYQLNVLGFDIQLYSGAFLSYIPPAAQTITAVNASKVSATGKKTKKRIDFISPFF